MKVSLKMQLLDKMETEGTFNSKPDYVDLVNLVRSIQRAEGNIDCYRRARQQCDRMSCIWRSHCLEAPSRGERWLRIAGPQNRGESDTGTGPLALKPELEDLP